MDDQVPEEVKEARNQELLGILKANSDRRNATLLGTTQEVLVEGPDKKGRGFMGRTRGNRIVHFKAQERLVGELVPVKIERASTAVLYGSLVLAGVAHPSS
jgi:tRNA-2-methylthio-N6-dimethylallyladenosine synthase